MVCILSCDPDWLDAWRKLKTVHARKSSTYGTDDDRLANFTAVAQVTGDPPERYPLLRIVEKCERALNMLAAGDALSVQEYEDIASLALCAKALQMRRGEAQEPLAKEILREMHEIQAKYASEGTPALRKRIAEIQKESDLVHHPGSGLHPRFSDPQAVEAAIRSFERSGRCIP